MQTFGLTPYGTFVLYDPSAITIDVTTQVEGVIDDRPALPAEVWNDRPVDIEKAWAEIERSCKGGSTC